MYEWLLRCNRHQLRNGAVGGAVSGGAVSDGVKQRRAKASKTWALTDSD